MNKFNKYLAYTALLGIFLCGESLSPLQLLSTVVFAAGLLWFAGELNAHHNANKFDSELLADAPIAQQTARDLRIEVKA